MMDYEYYEGNKNLVISFSTENYKILQKETGNIYDEAVDVFDHIDQTDGKPRSRFTYVEIDIRREIEL